MSARTGLLVSRRMLAVISASAVLVVSCASGAERSDASRFCGEIEANREALTQPDLTTTAQIDDLLDLYREIAEFAPLAIEAEWDQLVVNYETASSVVPGDEASRQASIATALQSERSAARVKTWLVENCGLDIGPVDTLVQQAG